MPGVLEMEEETESLIREVNKGSSSSMGKSAPSQQTKSSKRSTTLIALSAAVALLLLFLTSRGNDSSSSGGSDGLVENIQGTVESKGSSGDASSTNSNDDATTAGSSNVLSAPISSPVETSDSATTSSSSSSLPEIKHDDGQAFVYSKMATIPPDPYQTTVRSSSNLGKWGFWDGDEAMRPDYDYTADYPFHDIPGDKFPDDAWQSDAVFVNHLLNDAEQLVTRAKEAILLEYGHGKDGITAPEQLRERLHMFHWDILDLQPPDAAPPPAFTKRGSRGTGGWMTKSAQDGLVTRLLHAAMTNTPFVIVMGGHSAAAGHGNHFAQSYMMQLHKVLAPVLGRLGVQLQTRNMAQGGLGTLHNALGMQDIYGNDIDVLLWDSGMTERASEHIELFARQAILGGQKVPVLWGGHFDILRTLHLEADVEVGEFGNGRDGLLEVTSAAQAAQVPFAARYEKCSADAQEVCKEAERYCAKCWIQRPDVNASEKFWDIASKPSGQVKWHPGWRNHQLQGRVLAFAILDGLQRAIQNWSDGTMGGPPLDDDWWHVTDYYKNIKDKLIAFKGGACKDLAPGLPERVCTTALHARTQYTPRHDPENTSITSILVPAPNGYVPANMEKQVYEGPDVENSCFQIPENEVDVLGIISNRRRLNQRDLTAENPQPRKQNASLQPRHLAKGIVPGLGWHVFAEPPGHCNGEYGSICGRAPSDKCPMLGHHDARGCILGNEYAGWLVMDIPNVKEGLVILKMFTWREPSDQWKTKDWTAVNNEGPPLVDRPDPPKAIKDYADLPETFTFDYAIEGQITSLDKDQFIAKIKSPQRVMEVVTILDDPSFGERESLQIAIRMTGCGRSCTFGLTHIYWA